MAIFLECVEPTGIERGAGRSVDRRRRPGTE
jgi:hypothetical protein